MKSEKNEQVIDNLTLLCLRGQELSSISDLDSLLNRILETALEICNAEAASILVLDKSTNELFFKATVGEKANHVKKFRLKADKGIAGWVAENKRPAIVNDILSDSRHFKYIDDMVGYKTRNLICIPILWKNEMIAVMEALNKKDNLDFTEQDLEYLTILCNQAGASLHITGMMEKLQNFFVNMLEIMMMATETLGSNQGHSVRVARLATKIAREMGVSEKEYKDIYYASLIHDIGQIKVARDQIVGGERLIPILGAEMIRPINMLKSISRLVEHHHERWNGSGSPRGLKDGEIPLGSRIIGLAEEYIEWIEEESYKRQYDPYFQDDFFRQAAKIHDPDVLEAFKTIRKRERGGDAQRQAVMADVI